MQPRTPWNHNSTKPTCMSMKPSTKPVKPNPWNYETRETTKLMKSQNPGHYEKFPWNNSLLIKNMIMKSTKPMKTTRPLKSQNSWNRWKPWKVETLITTIKTLNLIPWMLWNLSPPQRPFCVVGRLGRKKKRAGGRWEVERERRQERLPSFPSSHRSPRAFYFSIIVIFIGIPSGSLCGGDTNEAMNP